jgi:hypothetical protein
MENASKAQAIDDLFHKYFHDIDGNPADLRKKAEADFEELVQKKKGGEDPKTVPGYDNKGQDHKKDPQNDMGALAKAAKDIYDLLYRELPIKVMS